MIIRIDVQSPIPIYEQIRDQVVLGIAVKQLAPDEALPSVRCLAADLGVHFHTVNKAYNMLCDEGYIVMNRRSGAVIARGNAGGEAFLPNLSRRLLLIAAEAVCHGIGRDELIALCDDCYHRAEGGAGNGGQR